MTDESNEVSNYWTSFIETEERSWRYQKSATFPSKVWAGISDDLRRKVWLLTDHCPKPVFQYDESKLADGVLDEIETELEGGSFGEGCIPLLDEKHKEIIRNVLRLDAVLNRLPAVRPGSVQLLAHIISVTQSISATVQVYQALIHQMEPYSKDGNKEMYTDVLVLSDVLAQRMPELKAHLVKNNFDVADLSSICKQWILPLFSCHFPSVFVRRAIDVALFDGPQYLMGVVYGVLKFMASEIGLHGEQFLYQHITSSTLLFTSLDTSIIFQSAFKDIRRREQEIVQLRARKDWEASVAQPGLLKLSPNVGDPACFAPPAIKERPAALAAISASAAWRNARKADHLSHMHGAPASPPFVPSTTSPLHSTGIPPEQEEKKGGSRRIPLVVDGNVSAGNISVLMDALVQTSNSDDPALSDSVKMLLHEAEKALELQQSHLTRLEDQSITEEARKHLDRSNIEDAGNGRGGGDRSIGINSSDAQPEDHEVKCSDVCDINVSLIPQQKSLDVQVENIIIGGVVPHFNVQSYASLPESGRNGLVRFSLIKKLLNFPTIFMEGYLLRNRAPSLFQRENSSGIFGDLARRFFILQGPYFTYFKSRSDTKPSKDVSVDMRTRVVRCAEKTEDGQQFSFEILNYHGNVLYTLHAIDEETRTKWVHALKEAAALPTRGQLQLL